MCNMTWKLLSTKILDLICYRVVIEKISIEEWKKIPKSKGAKLTDAHLRQLKSVIHTEEVNTYQVWGHVNTFILFLRHLKSSRGKNPTRIQFNLMLQYIKKRNIPWVGENCISVISDSNSVPFMMSVYWGDIRKWPCRLNKTPTHKKLHTLWRCT